jgi:DNA replication protein DnaC/transposase
MLDPYPSRAAQGVQRLREQGLTGGDSIGTASVRTVRPKRQPAVLTRACAPGEWAQVDGGACGSVPVGQTRRRLRFLVIVLCSSRMRSVECTVSQTLEHCLACHQHAWECFGGMPHTVMVDNLKAAVLQRALGDAPVFHPKYLDCATHCGFPMAPCHVGTGHAKGRVANGGGSVQQPALAGLALPDCGALNPAARQWLDTVANVRLHSETREQPVQAWHTERPYLSPLALHPFDSATGSQVRASRPWRLTLDTTRSSVPAHDAGQALTLTPSPDRLCLYHGDTLIARHARRDDRCHEVADPAHPKPLLEQRKKARDQQLFRRLLALSPRAEAYDLPRDARRLHPHHHGRTIVALSAIDPAEAVARAMEEALVSEAFSSASMANVWEQRARFTPEASAWHLTRREDLLEISLAPPDRSRSQATPQTTPHDTEAADTMSASPNTQPVPTPSGDVEPPLTSLTLSCMAQHYAELATQAAHHMWPHVDYRASLVEGEADVRRDRATTSRLRLARFPGIKTLEQCRWDWPTRINRLQGQKHGRWEFIKDKANVIVLGGVGLGKTHLATAPGSPACLQGYAVLLASAIEVINTLAAAKSAGRLKAELNQYTQPALLILDELGSLPLDKTGAALLFQVISLRYAQGARIMTSNRACKEWPTLFNHDSTLTSAVLDRLRHHADTLIIAGKSFRMKDHIESYTSLHQGSPDSTLLTPASSSLTLQCRIFTPPTPQRASHIFTWPIL